MSTTNLTQKEVEEIQEGVSDYLVEIADILAKVPRTLLLLLKTNDLLRSIENKLSPTHYGNTYAIMAKYCNSVSDELDSSNVTTWSGWASEKWRKTKVSVKIQTYLWLNSFFKPKN